MESLHIPTSTGENKTIQQNNNNNISSIDNISSGSSSDPVVEKTPHDPVIHIDDKKQHALLLHNHTLTKRSHDEAITKEKDDTILVLSQPNKKKQKTKNKKIKKKNKKNKKNKKSNYKGWLSSILKPSQNDTDSKSTYRLHLKETLRDAIPSKMEKI